MKGKINLFKRAGTDCTIIELVKCIYPINKKNFIIILTVLQYCFIQRDSSQTLMCFQFCGKKLT